MKRLFKSFDEFAVATKVFNVGIEILNIEYKSFLNHITKNGRSINHLSEVAEIISEPLKTNQPFYGLLSLKCWINNTELSNKIKSLADAILDE